MNKIAEFVNKKRVIHADLRELPKIDAESLKGHTNDVEFKPKGEKKTPWYKRPLERNEFSYRKAKDNKFYVRHKEWSKKTWIGPYDTEHDVNVIVTSYVLESLKEPLDRKTNKNIHSICVENDNVFFISNETIL